MLARIRLLLACLLSVLPLNGQRVGGASAVVGTTFAGHAGHTYNSCLTHAWPMNEGSGTVFHDIIGGTHLTLGSASYVTWQSNTGMPGTTPRFNGLGGASAASTDMSTNFDGSAAFSIIVWTIGSGSAGVPIQQMIIGDTVFSSPYRGWELFQDSNSGGAIDVNAPVFHLVNNYSANALQQAAGFTAMSSATLHYVAVSYDGTKSQNGVNINLDGTNFTGSANNVFNTLTGTTASGRALVIGDAVGGGFPFTGAISFAALYNCALTTTQMGSYFSAGPQIN